MYAFSTCWNSHRHTDGREMLREIRDLGFEYAELSHGIRLSLAPGIFEAVNAGEIKISTLHNFCPLPIGVTHAAPNLFKFTAEDRRERDNAYRHTLKTLETAEKVNARLVVLHLGDVPMKNYTERLSQLLEKGKGGSSKYDKLSMEVLQKREQKKEKFMELAGEMLQRIEEQASRRGLLLGVENREALEEIPFETDFTLFFKQFNSPAIRYWHDFGHAQIKENLGFINHKMHLEALADRLAGFHIHDVAYPCKDHRAPGAGTIRFEDFKPFAQPDHLKVFEFSPSLDAEEARRGVAFVQSAWGE